MPEKLPILFHGNDVSPGLDPATSGSGFSYISSETILKPHLKNTLRSGDILFHKRDQKNNELQKLMDAFNQRFPGSF